jgi:hypothetical protein
MHQQFPNRQPPSRYQNNEQRQEANSIQHQNDGTANQQPSSVKPNQWTAPIQPISTAPLGLNAQPAVSNSHHSANQNSISATNNGQYKTQLNNSNVPQMVSSIDDINKATQGK